MFKFVIINNIMIEKILYSYALKYSRFWTNSSKNAITMLTYLSPKRKKLLFILIKIEIFYICY